MRENDRVKKIWTLGSEKTKNRRRNSASLAEREKAVRYLWEIMMLNRKVYIDICRLRVDYTKPVSYIASISEFDKKKKTRKIRDS